MSRGKKALTVCLCIIGVAFTITGCGASSNGKNIIVNTMYGSVTLSKVNFYDFYNSRKFTNYSGTLHALSGSLNSTSITLLDSRGTTRVVCVNKKLSSRPSSVLVYTNRAKSTYDTYSCSN